VTTDSTEQAALLTLALDVSALIKYSVISRNHDERESGYYDIRSTAAVYPVPASSTNLQSLRDSPTYHGVTT